MNRHKDLEKILIEMISNRNFKYQEWSGKFKQMKYASPTEKGDLGEDFLADILKREGYSQVEVMKGRRGHYDVALAHNNKELLFEVKVATRDIHKNFQFNGIRYDTKYTHLFCLGISPDALGFLIIAKESLGKGEHLLVPMAKGSNATFKLTKPEGKLLSFDKFGEVIKELVS